MEIKWHLGQVRRSAGCSLQSARACRLALVYLAGKGHSQSRRRMTGALEGESNLASLARGALTRFVSRISRLRTLALERWWQSHNSLDRIFLHLRGCRDRIHQGAWVDFDLGKIRRAALELLWHFDPKFKFDWTYYFVLRYSVVHNICILQNSDFKPESSRTTKVYK